MKIREVVAIFILAFAVMLVAVKANADLLVRFDRPVVREDGTPMAMSEIDRYELFAAEGGLVTTIPFDVEEFIVQGFVASPRQCFEMITVDTEGLLSAPAEACLKGKPGKVNNLKFRNL